MDFKKQVTIIITMIAILFLTSCSVNKDGIGDVEKKNLEIPLYDKKTTKIHLAENSNPYMMDYGKDGVFYFSMEEVDEAEITYHFFYQKYDEDKIFDFCELREGYVRDFSQRQMNQQLQLCVLQGGAGTHILIYDDAGNNIQKLNLDENLDNMEESVKLAAMPNGNFAIAMGNRVYILNQNGQIIQEIDVDNNVDSFCLVNEDELFVSVWKNEKNSSKKQLIKLNAENGNTEQMEYSPQEVMEIFPYEEGFTYIFSDRIEYYNPKLESSNVLVDLNKQCVLAGQIKAMIGNSEEIKLLSMDPDDTGSIMIFTLSDKKETEIANGNEKNLFTADGRRIICVAVPKEYEVSVEYHAKKYNQKSDIYYVEVERLEEPLAVYLGKGNTPDVILLKDHTEINQYTAKKMLADFIPLFSQQETYEIEDVIPKAREVLSVDNPGSMYAMAGRFNLLIRTSIGNENDDDDECNTISYMRWFDNFYTEHEIEGMSDVSLFLYAVLPEFYDEKLTETSFDSEEFKRLMEEYKELISKHEGEFKRNRTYKEKGEPVRSIACGPEWRKDYKCFDFQVPRVRKRGLPGMSGEELIYIKMDYPMSILETSECKEGAFDFIMYYCSLNEFAQTGYEYGYGMSINTSADFSTFDKVLNELIFESEISFGYGNELSNDGIPILDQYIELFYKEEDLEQLRYLINNAIPTTRAQEDIYSMLMEEIEPYLREQKDLDSCCKILQSRVELYLSENN